VLSVSLARLLLTGMSSSHVVPEDRGRRRKVALARPTEFCARSFAGVAVLGGPRSSLQLTLSFRSDNGIVPFSTKDIWRTGFSGSIPTRRLPLWFPASMGKVPINLPFEIDGCSSLKLQGAFDLDLSTTASRSSFTSGLPSQKQ
jgi:hypothetical protein